MSQPCADMVVGSNGAMTCSLTPSALSGTTVCWHAVRPDIAYGWQWDSAVQLYAARMQVSLFSSLQCLCNLLHMGPRHQGSALRLGVFHEATHFSVVYGLVGHHRHGADTVAVASPDQQHPASAPTPKLVRVGHCHSHVPAAVPKFILADPH